MGVALSQIHYTAEVTVRVIVEVFGRAYVFSFLQGKVMVGDPEDNEFDRAPLDPHSVSGGQMENASDQGALEVQRLSGAGVYQTPEDHTRVSRRFGFGNGC